MAEPYHSNIRNFLESASEARCMLCHATVILGIVHYCPVETRIREIVREEMRAQTVSGQS